MPRFRRRSTWGTSLVVSEALHDLAKRDCLCRNCDLHRCCPAADRLFRVCLDFKMALGVTACPAFVAEEVIA